MSSLSPQSEIDDLRAKADNTFTAWKSAKKALRQAYQVIGIERGGVDWSYFINSLKAHVAERDAEIEALKHDIAKYRPTPPSPSSRRRS